MPTKPTDTITQIATDTNYSTSPVTDVNGQPTKVALVVPAEGFIPGRAAGAANANWLWNTANKFIQWVKSGTNAADKDAHIVETDEFGVIQTAALFVADDTGYNYGIIAGNTVAGDAAARTIYAYQTEDGIAIEGRNTVGTGTAIKGACDGTGGDGVLGVAAGTGIGGGIHGQASGASKISVYAERLADNDLPALIVTGDFSSPVRGLFTIDVQTEEPTVSNVGDFYASSVDSRIGVGSRWSSIGHRPEGWLDDVAFYNDGPLPIPTVVWTDIVELEIVSVRVGVVVITATVATDLNTATGLNLRIYDDTASTAVLTTASASDDFRSFRISYVLPASSFRTFKLQGQSLTNPSNVNFATLTVEGIWTTP